MKKLFEPLTKFLESLSQEDAVAYLEGIKQTQRDIEQIEAGEILCGHPILQGDDYGESCGVCKERLAGYGYFEPYKKDCLHNYIPTENSDYEICIYCGDSLLMAEGANSDSSQEPGQGKI